ncbi:MAG: hypothetical protein H6740_14880 [Alphaproteobacteria bacterium]|nr:hypothetical protein [Alphaproteobacteria bacterium]
MARMRSRSAPPRRITDDEALIGKTLAHFQPMTTRQLGREDAREIIYNLSGAFTLLMQWRQAELAEPTLGGGE